ncbi:MAG: nucleoside deaminase, partial [Candidatus Nanopelagicales bacterium]
MGQALELARQSMLAGDDVPVGALVLGPDGAVLSSSANRREALSDPTAHAEVVVLREAAAARGDWDLSGCSLVVTL